MQFALLSLTLIYALVGANHATIQTTEVCIPVSIPLSTQPVPIYGVMYRDAQRHDHTTALILVHGGHSTHKIWDFDPNKNWSISRHLAERIDVLAIDRLGYGNSVLLQDFAGFNITIPLHQDILNQITLALRNGQYQGAVEGLCTAINPIHTLQYQKIVAAGWSIGSRVVMPTAGRYGELDGIIAMAGSQFGGNSQLANQFIFNYFIPQRTVSDYGWLFPNVTSCKETWFYGDAFPEDEATRFCLKTYLPATPFGDPLSILDPALNASYIQFMRQTDPTVPVLIIYMDHELNEAADSGILMLQFWQSFHQLTESYVVANSSHVFQLHNSIPQTEARIVQWLSDHHFIH